MAITRNDVAKHCKVSPSTVSNVLNNVSARVSPEVREKVLKGMRELGYIPDEAARRLRMSGGPETGKALNRAYIGFVIPECAPGGFNNGLYARILNGILQESSREGIRLIVDRIKDGPEEPGGPPTMLQAWSIDGLIITGAIDPGFIERAADMKLPIVQLDAYDRGGIPIDSISGEDYRGVFEAVKYLTDSGHRRIAMIKGTENNPSMRDRLGAYRAALEAAGIAFDEGLTEQGDLGYAGGLAAAQKLAREGKKFTAVFAANDESALGAKAGLEQLGLKVPADVSIIGYDNIPMAAQVVPALTTVEQDHDEMGRIAVRRLVKRLGEPGAPTVKLKLPARLVVRDSVRILSRP